MGTFVDAFTSDLATAKNLDAAMDMLAVRVSTLGFQRVLYAYTPSPRTRDGFLLPPPVVCRNFPVGWKKHWHEVNQADPYYRACFDTTLPIDWHELRCRNQLTAAERRTCHYMDDYGMPFGITVPIHMPDGAFAGLSAVWRESGSENEWRGVSTRALDAIFLVAHHFHYTIHPRFHGPTRIDTPHLTSRELECLEWAAVGKSSSEIGAIIGCSMETVRFHFKNIMRKLDSVNRAQALIKAIHFGLISGSRH